MHKQFSGQTAVVTGGASGIGAAIARRFAAQGAAVLIADRDEAGADHIAAQLRAGGAQASALGADLADPAQPARIVAGAQQRYGALDIVVHNAAYFPLTDFTAIDAPLLERTFAVNVWAAFHLLQAALPGFQARGGGRMLVTSSVTGPRVAYPGLAHYAASKSAVNGFIRAAALEVARHGVTVNGVEPGMIQTPAQANLGDAGVTGQLRQRIPLGRLGTPDDIAGAMLFLASPDAAYITGQTIIVDGGALLPEN
ncbi:SDR family oxidoreductase [Duganella sp.]|uniref:SDR family oxidoreductase n=1 Tax=Duganella sp. TaxID=1904440 RepID=UPI0031E1CED9